MNNIQTMYVSEVEKTAQEAKAYSQTEQSLCRYLAYRDLPYLIQKYVKGDNALDYGAGTGLSTQFLLEQGFKVKGVDVSNEMLAQAKISCPSIHFSLIKNGVTSFESGSFDFILSSFVLFEISSQVEIISYLNEARRLLKKNGILILLTGSQTMYSGKWLVMDTNFPENKNPKSGDRVKIHLPDINVEFIDYYWSQSDYNAFFKETNFNIEQIHYPLGKIQDPFPWKDELIKSPFAIYILQPNQKF